MPPDFEAPYLDSDPWGYQQHWYENRRRHLIAAMLPYEQLGHVLEVGCANGLMAKALASRSQHWLGVDIASRAIELAQQQVQDAPNVTLWHMDITAQWPAKNFDTVLMCDVGYYMDDIAIQHLASQMRQTMTPQAVLLAAHWRHDFEEVVTPTPEVHRILAKASKFKEVAQYSDKDLLVQVWTRNGLSVAQQEGLL